jgi:hypothetical protein
VRESLETSIFGGGGRHDDTAICVQHHPRALRLRLSRTSSFLSRRLISSTTPARAASRVNCRRSSSPFTSSLPAYAFALWCLGLAAGGAEPETESATVAEGGRCGKEIVFRDLARRREESVVETTPAATDLAAAVAMAQLLPAGDGWITAAAAAACTRTASLSGALCIGLWLVG